MDPALQELYAEGEADDEVAVILRLAEDGRPPEGVRIVARFGPIATCRLRRGDIPVVREADVVRSMKAAHLYGPTPVEAEDHEGFGYETFDDDPANPRLGDIRRPAGDLPTGRGIVIAHIDWGVDFAHPDFRDEHGRTRLLALWDQGKGMDPARPNRYGYGRVHTTADIDRALATPKPYDALDYHPADSDTGPGSHGTHTLGISAGNGRAGGPLGMAPEADLVFVHLSTYTADGPARLGDSVALLEAFDFIAGVANGRPVAINASIGKQAGEHDGKTVVEQGMDAFLLAHPGRAIVLSTGNYFKRDSHARGMLRPGESRTLHLVADSARRTPTEVDLWYSGVDRFIVTVRGPDGKAEVKAGPGEKAEIIVDGREIGRLYHRICDPNNGDNQVTLYLYKVAPPARWELTLYGDDVADGRYHAWVERDGVCATCQAHFIAADAEPTGTTGTICNGLRTIAVGAYDARRQERPLAPFSSCGPTRDGRQKPDLVAPGVKVLAARSAPRDPGPETPLLTCMSGTSMAAPHVTGAIALLFAAAGRLLHIEETRRLLLGNSEAAPADADTLDHLRMGSGYLDTSAAIAAARQSASTKSISLNSNHQNVRKTVMNESTDADEASRREKSHVAEPAPLPFQVQLPIGGGSPALALPIGGAASPIAFSVPLGGSPAPAAPAAPVAPVAAAPATPAGVQPGNEPVKTADPDFPLYVAPTEIEWADSGAPGERPLIRRGSRGPAVREAQQKLNAVHQRSAATGGPGLNGAPLAEDGAFGDHTYQAVVSFQRLAFPDQPREWDGVIGPKTWAMLDQLSADLPIQPIPPAPLPNVPDNPPVVNEGCGNLTIWINAFIPQNVPGYTFTVPGGPHAGKTAIPCPTAVASLANPNCFRLGYLTDQRSFSTSPSASVRMRSLAEIQLIAPRLVRTVHETSGTTEINRNTGVVTCTQMANMGKCSFSGFSVTPRLMPAGSFVIALSYKGGASDPCVNLAADIDYEGDIEILCVPSTGLLEVNVKGKVDSFPAFEMYASLGGVTKTIFTLPPPSGNTVVDLLGGASTSVAGRATFACSFGATVPGGQAFAADQPTQTVETAETMESAEAAWFAAWKEALANPERYTPMPEYQAQEQAAESVPFTESAASQSDECHCGERLLAAADAYAQSEALRPASAEALIESLLNAEEEREVADEAEGDDIAVLAPPRTLPYTPTALFNAFAYTDSPPQRRAARQRLYARRLQCIAAPGDHLTDLASAPRPGDLLIRVARGEGWGNVSVVAAAGLHPLEHLAGKGLRAEGGEHAKPGAYLHVIEILPKAQASYTGFARRLTDGASMVLGDTLLLRPRGASMPRVSAEAVESCGCATEAATEAESGYIPEADAPALPAALASPCITLDRFARDSDKLLPEHRKQIADAARDILKAGSISVIVTGYASTDGANDYNFALGMRRATAVTKALHDALETAKPGSSKGIALIPRSRGEEEQIAGGTLTLNRRVTICPAVPQPKPQPQPIQQRYFFLFAKSFIAHIGANTGSLNCGIGPFTSPTTNPALKAFAAATDAAFSEDPWKPYMFVAPPPENKGYRLFSSVRVQVEYRGQEILSVTPFGGILTDSGKECLAGGVCLQAPPLIEDVPFTVNRISPSRMQFKWGVKGRPPGAAELAFDTICKRSCVYIWHQVKGTVDCSSGVPVFTSLVIEGSRFPSHRLWLDDKQVSNVPQGPFSALWDEVPGDPSRVR